MIKRKICVVVTARPSYSRVKSALTAIKNHPNLELQLVLTSSSLLGNYGSIINVIKADGFDVADEIYNVIDGPGIKVMAKTTGNAIIELSSCFDRLKPDIVVTIADRYETMATAIAASYKNIPLAHIQGGEVTGNIDEKVRHAITKLADYHFVASQRAYERVVKMGENPKFVFNTGCPSVDIAHEIFQNNKLDFNPFEKYGGVGNNFSLDKGYLVVMQHPVTTSYNDASFQIKHTLDAVNELGMPTFWFWPNVDAGSDATSNSIRTYREFDKLQNVHFFKNMEPKDFLKLLKNSKCLIGNSSVGIRECSYLSIPVVNIGDRQIGRERGDNVIDVEYDKIEIINAISNQLNNNQIKSNKIYGDGNSGKEIAEKLNEVPFLFSKILNY